MEIYIERGSGFALIFKADNVHVTENIEEHIYPKDAKGKTDFKGHTVLDIKEEALDQIVSLLNDMIYYRTREYDSSDLISALFDKLPPDVADRLAMKLAKDYVLGKLYPTLHQNQITN